MTDVFTLVETALYSKLTTSPGTALYGSRVYSEQAPLGAGLPYLLYYLLNGGDDNDCPDRSLTLTYHVECIALTQADARAGAGYIDTALHHQALTITGFTAYWVVMGGLFRQVDNVEGKQFWRRGGNCQINISA